MTACGTPRRVLNRTGLTQHRRLVMDAWGQARLYPGVNTPPNSASSSVPSSTTINVYLPHRLPGQLQGPGEPLVENRYRYYVPTLGQYLTPDPMHQASVMSPGPQAYAYANGNPLRFSDPDGRLIVDRDALRRCAGCDEDADSLVGKFGKAWQLAWEAANRRPECRAFFERYGVSLASLLQTDRPPYVSFKESRGDSNGWHDTSRTGGLTGGDSFFIACQRCKTGSVRELAATLVHEVLHTAQPGLNAVDAHADRMEYELPAACFDLNPEPDSRRLGQ